MTHNQRRALKLADQIRGGSIAADGLDDSDWSLLLLAAGLNSANVPPWTVASRILSDFDAGCGYFLREGFVANDLPSLNDPGFAGSAQFNS